MIIGILFLQAHCQSHTIPTLHSKLCQRACKANTPREIVLKNFLTFKKNKKTQTHNPTQTRMQYDNNSENLY